ncbi:DUF1566 domain-containing protein [Sulfurimonas sp. SWIR-19]|uniref:Lcl C-terminal domain-containing protein n=1 Tax=Sulfurimonas sp. SWIR-19 TaxID=2878390 RepID=UPI001CF2B49B|nr:DUF1566 domain-containing protein [Sulfurimonas sp. SWIR-19]UCN00938.1 DUF1566 domain-containing protein [Sulfurimonas sp. SWIR-19]
MQKIFMLLFVLFSSTEAQEIVTDTEQKLQWLDTKDMQEFNGIWKLANSYCEALHVEQKDDWRLPTKKELQHLGESKKLKTKFRHLDTALYWSKDIDKSSDGFNAYTVYTGNGFVSSTDKCHTNKLVCVRKLQ